jgi:hypothetical protein
MKKSWRRIAVRVPRHLSVGEQNANIKRSENPPPKANAARASHPDRIRTWFPACLVTAWRRNDRSGPSAHYLKCATFAKAVCRFAILRSPTRNRCGGHRPCPAPGSEEPKSRTGGGRNARATQGSRRSAYFWNPPATHSHESPACRWLCRNHSARSGTLTFSLHSLSPSPPRPRNTKNSPPCAEPVDVVPSLWNPEEI